MMGGMKIGFRAEKKRERGAGMGKTSNIERPTSNIERGRFEPPHVGCYDWGLRMGWWVLNWVVTSFLTAPS